MSDIGNIPLLLPTLSEQREIVCFLDSFTRQFDTLVSEAVKSIDLLLERRTALISAAVTGQIDVRGLAPSEAA
jgi:type I restriction enzyme S subunit